MKGGYMMYSIKELASKLHVHENTVRNWIKDKRLNVIRMGGQIRITDEQLKQFLEKGGK